MKRAERKSATRQRLMDAAVSAFTSNGYDDVNLRDIARAIGMSTGAIYAHVGSKAELYAEAMGTPAPDVPAFLERVAIACAGSLDDLSREAMLLRAQLVGA